MSDVWKDPRVKAALRERSPDDIMVMDCRKCGVASYYNQGSHFTCRSCGATHYVLSEGEEPMPGMLNIAVDDARTLGDTADEDWEDHP